MREIVPTNTIACGRLTAADCNAVARAKPLLFAICVEKLLSPWHWQVGIILKFREHYDFLQNMSFYKISTIPNNGGIL